ncbi:AraC family transcriptional regulator [Nocardia africana]|uniref:DNA-binding transcriptional activator FeaR n=1 Tax=Nocardia africana TaxID=134964 RepID=A0A378WYC1_9NOCA|nr:AraC family transcriptional regulator [Nocardia africana]MCC3312913.1 AraC family transcriptional regulator [Nocardia africana]SUA45747.1 DNA-binding transcriptional activator FeaR [Nocardia africana]
MLMVRSAVLNGYVDLALSLGLNPHPLMRTVGIDPAAVADTDGWLPAEAINRLLELSATETACEDFGLRLAAARGISTLGPIGLVAREEPDVRSALEILLRHGNLHNEALNTRLTENNGLATVRVQAAPGATLGRQAVELVVAATCRILRDLLHEDWKPLTTCFTHPAPAAVDVHHRMLSDTIDFGCEFDGIVFYGRDLDATNPLADPLLRPYTRQYLQSLAVPGDTTADQVRRAIESLLPTQRCSAAQVAHSLGMDRRTLHRHLTRTGETFSSILDTVRTDLAQRYVARQDRTMTEIAADLGFSELSAFSRWFHTRFGCAPTQWDTRTAHVTKEPQRDPGPS